MRTRAGCSGACVQVFGAVNASPADPKEPRRMLGEARGVGEVSITKKTRREADIVLREDEKCSVEFFF